MTRALSAAILCLLAAALSAPAAPTKEPPPGEVLDQMVAFIRDRSKKDVYATFAKHVLQPEGTEDANRMQRATIRSLRQFGGKAVPYLIEFMTLPNHWTGPVAQQTLAQIGKPACAPVLAVLKEGPGPRVNAALGALLHMGHHVVTELLALTADPNPHAREHATLALQRMMRPYRRSLKPAQLAAVKHALTLQLDDAVPAVRRAAVDALPALGGTLEAAVPKLIAMLATKEDAVAWAAAKAIGSMDEAAVPALTAALTADSDGTRRYAAFAIARIGKGDALAVATLVKCLNDKSAAVRRNVADALGRLNAAEAVKPLIAALKDVDVSVQVEAADALAAGDAEAVAAQQAWRAARGKLSRAADHVIPEHRYGGIYPSKVPGYPGSDGTLWIDYDNRGGPRPIWGHPQWLPYPGSIEHVRQNYIKYFPVKSRWDGASLIKLWRAPGVPGLGKAEAYAEPIYYNPMYGLASPTGETRAPVQVQRWRVGQPITLKLGALKPSYYILRVVAALETEQVRRIPKQIVMRFEVNDSPKGETRAFTRRFRCVDEFYSMSEWYFRAWDDREFTVTLSLVEGTEVELLAHTVDLHDHLTFCARRPGKEAATLHPLKQRAADRAAATQTRRHRAPSNIPLTPEEQARWDAATWAAMPDMNSQFLNGWGSMPAPPADEVAEAKAQGKKDNGWGVYLPKSRTYWAPVAAANDGARHTFEPLAKPLAVVA